MTDVLQRVIEHALESRDHLAVKDPDKMLTYVELVRDVERLAAGFRARGVGDGDRVVLLLPNCVEFVVAALACNWLGAAFVPLAVSDPVTRLEAIVEDCAPALVVSLSSRDGASNAPSSLGSQPVLDVNDLLDDGRDRTCERVSVGSRVAYVIYTSGTTGTPKGVQISANAFLAAVGATATALSLHASTITLCVSPVHFDGSFGTLFPTLLVGGTVVMRPREALLFPRTFFNAIATEHVTYTGFSPSYLRLLLNSPRMNELEDSTLEIIALGGEASSLADLHATWALAPSVQLFNRYGPTETTIAVTHVLLTPDLVADGVVPMGSPHEGVTFYVVHDGEVLDGDERVGELYVGGSQLMDGYWGAPALTEEVLRRDVVAGDLLYRTGDLVYRSRSGHYVYVDRADQVIKRSGVRVSLLEVTDALRRLPHVRAAACVTYDLEGELGIAAFVVVEGPFDDLALFRAAHELLPATMVPNHFAAVASLPLTASSKLDDRRLLREAGLAPAPRPARRGDASTSS